MSSTPGGFVPVRLQLRDGRSVAVRQVRVEDREALQALMQRHSAESRYARFMSALRELPLRMLERAVHPAPDRELQLVAVVNEGVRESIVAGARYAAAPGSRDCEFAVTVEDVWQGVGLARQLLGTLMASAHARGFERMEGYILASNSRMLGLAQRLGFERVAYPEDPTVHLVRRTLAR